MKHATASISLIMLLLVLVGCESDLDKCLKANQLKQKATVEKQIATIDDKVIDEYLSEDEMFSYEWFIKNRKESWAHQEWSYHDAKHRLMAREILTNKFVEEAKRAALYACTNNEPVAIVDEYGWAEAQKSHLSRLRASFIKDDRLKDPLSVRFSGVDMKYDRSLYVFYCGKYNAKN